MNEAITCFTCPIVNEYVELAGNFTENLSETLIPAMWKAFSALASFWIVIQGIKLILGSLDIGALAREFIYMIIAAGLLAGQGPQLVNTVYSASLSTISGAAATVLFAGAIADETGITAENSTASGSSKIAGLDGMTALVGAAEKGVFKVFKMVEVLIESSSGWGPNVGAFVTAVLILLPYALLLIVYFAQVVVTIFRVMAICALSPIIMLMVGFNFSRGMFVTALRTLFASFMVLYGATIALAVCLYGVASMDIAAEPFNEREIELFLDWSNPRLWVTIMLGWLGTAFMAEATSIANSISSANLTNQAAVIITAGTTATGLTMLRHGKGRASQAYRRGRTLVGNAFSSSGGEPKRGPKWE
ncbi:hypothetical protein [Nisaea sp.]|uniref:hypothetical protein n=1 Tax=Nisaea sp. TaxID=2024842 RepID=UPI00326466D9